MEGHQIPQELWGQDSGTPGNLSPSTVPLALKTQTLKQCHTWATSPMGCSSSLDISVCAAQKH